MVTFPNTFNLVTPEKLGETVGQSALPLKPVNFGVTSPTPPPPSSATPKVTPTPTTPTTTTPITPSTPPPTTTPPPTSTPTSTPPTTIPTTISTPNTENGSLSAPDERAALEKATADFEATSKQVSDTILGFQNGSIPLNPGEQAQVDGMKNQYDTLISQQRQQNEDLKMGTTILAARSGNLQYAPGLYMSQINKVVTDGLSKVSDLMIKEASAVATLTQGFHDKDISAVKDAWAAYKDAYTERKDTLTKTINDATAAIKAAQDQINTTNNYNLDVAKFNQTGDQNAFDNAFKVEQERAAQARDAEAARHNKATEAIGAFKAGMGAGGGGTGGVYQSAQLDATGNPTPESQKAVADQIVAQYGPMTLVAIQSLADYSLNPGDWKPGATKGMTRDQAVTLAKMYDPTYNDAMYTVRATYMKNLASAQTGTVGSAVNSANKAVNHLTAFVTSMGKLNNSPISGLNWINQITAISPGERQAIGAAKTEGLGVAEELAKFFKGSGTVDVASIDAWKNELSTSASPGDVQGLTQGAITLLTGQLQTLTEQYQQTMGKAPETDFLNPSARASLSSLKNQGYQVDIPGILYTDKAAYIKNDPTAQQNMTQAVTDLTNAGLPVTPENILQYAQSL